MTRRAVTMRDVAERAGVSVSTVSRVLSGAETAIPITEETRQRVLEAVSELRYTPHPSARALRGKDTHLIGVIVREIGDPFFAQLIGVISEVAKRRKYDLVLGHARSDPEEALALSEILDVRRCDGLLLLGELGKSPKGDTFLDEIERGHRIVSVSRGSRELTSGHPCVAVDNHKGALMALDYLYRLGHRRIAFVDGCRSGDLQERKETYRGFVADILGKSGRELIQSGENSYAGGYRAAATLLSASFPPTAIFAADDTMAIGVLKAAADMGYSVPRDVSVIGFDDIGIASYLQPALTTVRQPIEALGQTAVDLLLGMVTDGSDFSQASQLLVEPELIVRDSCAPPIPQHTSSSP